MSEKTVDISNTSDLIPGGIGIYEISDGKPVIKYANARLADILGFDRNFDTENRCIYHEDDVKIGEAVSRMEFGSSLCMPARILRRNGRYKWYRFDIVCTGGENEKAIYYLTISSIDQAVIAGEKIDRLMDNTPCGICGFLARQNKISVVYANTYARNTIDISVAESVIDGDISRLIHPEDKNIFEKVKQDTLYGSHNADFDFRVIAPSGKVVWVHGNNIAIQTRKNEWAIYTAFMDVTKQKIAEQLIAEREAQSRIAINAADLIVWYYNISDGSYNFDTGVSRRYHLDVETFHMGLQAVIDSGFILPESINDFISLHDKIKSGESECSAILHINSQIAHFEWMKFVYTAVYNSDGNVSGAVGIAEDVTGLIDARMRFNEEVSFRKAVKSRTVASFKINITENTVLDSFVSNNDFSELAQCKNAEDFLEAINDFADTETLSCILLKNYYNQGKTVFSEDFGNYKNSNKYCYTRRICHLMKNPEKNDIVCFINFEDITHETILANITENIISKDYEFAVVIDLEHNSASRYIKRSNDIDDLPEVAEEYEYTTISHIKQTANAEDAENLSNAVKIRTIRKELRKNQSYSYYYSTVIDGKAMEKQLNFSYLDRDASIVLMTRSDITELVKKQNEQKKKLQKALDDAKQANLAKTYFLSKMSHEIRTPMNAIIGLTRLAKDETNDSAAMEKYLDNIQSSSDYLLGLINDILDVSRIESGKLELNRKWCSISELFNSVLTMIKPMAEEKNIIFTYPDPEKINSNLRWFIDPMRVKQVLINLLNNSCKFTQTGGEIHISINNITNDGRKSVDRVTISDTGCGMSEEFIRHLGEPFMQEENCFTGTVSGTGLGLTIVKKILTAMGGDIICESELGKGTTFTIIFPYEYGIVNGDEIERENEKVSLEDIKILIVEDNEINLQICSRILQKNGAEIVCVRNGRQAVETFENSTDGEFDCILMDVRMPVMNGIDATQAIRKLMRNDAEIIPIIALTADAFTEDMGKTINAGMNAHLSKPIDADKLARTIFHFVKKYRK